MGILDPTVSSGVYSLGATVQLGATRCFLSCSQCLPLKRRAAQWALRRASLPQTLAGSTRPDPFCSFFPIPQPTNQLSSLSLCRSSLAPTVWQAQSCHMHCWWIEWTSQVALTDCHHFAGKFRHIPQTWWPALFPEHVSGLLPSICFSTSPTSPSSCFLISETMLVTCFKNGWKAST